VWDSLPGNLGSSSFGFVQGPAAHMRLMKASAWCRMDLPAAWSRKTVQKGNGDENNALLAQ